VCASDTVAASSGFISEPHDPNIDAIASIKLYKMYHDRPRELEMAKKKLMSVRPAMAFGKRHNYRYEDVCLAAFYPAKCFCGAPTKSTS
jgi:RNA exonuclease 4